VLALLALGCGLLLERVIGVRIPGPLLIGTGLAVLICAGQFLTLSDATAELVAPVVVALAVAGFGLGRRRWPSGPSWWAGAAALAVFAVYAAPVVLSGHATFAGYIKLDDTATFLALTDRVIEHGRSLDGLAPSTYEATLDANIEGYPIGSLHPLGVGHQLLGTDLAWLFQPYLAGLAATLALGLWALASPLSGAPRLRAVVVFLAAQPALLYGYYLWGGVKEIAAAALATTAIALAAHARRGRLDETGEREPGLGEPSLRHLAPVAFVAAALIGVLGTGGAVWVLPSLGLVALLLFREIGAVATLLRATALIATTAVIALPALVVGLLRQVTADVLTAADELGNLLEPLRLAQLGGIWPAGDFRVDPVDPTVAYILVAIAVGAALTGLVVAVRGRAWAPVVYVVGTLAGCIAVVVVGSPWVDGKALAIASPAIPFAAALLGAIWWTSGRRVEGGVLLLLLAVGILWSNALAYRDVGLAPRDELAELEQIGEEFAGQGPTLLTEYNPYGARHFLREADPEAVSELRRRPIPLADGGTPEKGASYDADEVSLPALLEYRTLVLPRSPTRSRPPSAYEEVWTGRYYEVWQRRPESPPPFERLTLGDAVDPTGEAACGEVRALAEIPEAVSLAAARGGSPPAFSLQEIDHPSAWEAPEGSSSLVPSGPGELTTTVEVPRSGEYEVWLGGSVHPEVELRVDGRSVDSVRHELRYSGLYVQLGTADLSAGSHEIEVDFGARDLHPGSGGVPSPVGPLVISEAGADENVVRVSPEDAEELCGMRWDWVEAVGAPG
jgi:hypothetical protein